MTMRTPSKRGSYASQIPRWTGLANIFVGLLAMVSWYAHWQKVLQLIPNTAPMQFNTALCFLACGTSLFLLTTSRAKYSPLLGGAAATFGFLTLLEYLTGLNFHVDLLFFTPFFEAATAYPGRMAPLAAVCFVMVGTALMLAGSKRPWRHRFETVGILMCIVGIIAVVALIGFAFGIVSAYGWGAYSSLALNTSVMFLLLSIGLLVFAWETARQNNSNFERWLPITGSVTLMAMVAIIAVSDVHKLQAAAFWRKHTTQTITASQTFENNLIDLQRAMRSYVSLGDTNALNTFHQMRGVEQTALADLFVLTLDNPSQQARLKQLETAFNALLINDQHLIKLYDQGGTKAAFNFDTDKQSRTFFGAVHDQLKAFTAVEEELLDLRDTSEENGFRDTERLLVFACALAVALLLLANFMASNQLAKRRLAEARLALQAEALRRSNVELQQFAYVASHDMREPLRAVSGFAQILKNDCAADLDAEAGQTIDRIVDGAQRMSNIIDDLLALSSISSQKKPFEKIGLEQPLAVALENLSVAVRERNVVVRHEPLPEVMIDPSQISLLFQNLIGNGIKFCRNHAPEILVSSTREPSGSWTISVRDNGIGINPKHFSKIFGIFQRLHSREEYPGTGIGLAICKKIVERHGGRIWLESQPGIGTTFLFTLTDRQPDKYDGEPATD